MCFFLYKTVITFFLFLILQANPGVSAFKHVGLPDPDLCKNVFDKASVTGGLGYSSSQMPPDIDEEQDIEDRFLYPDGRPSEQDADEEAFQDYIGGAHSGDKRPGPSAGRGRGRKKRTTDAEGVSAAMMEVASALRARTDISLASQRMNCETVNNEDDYSLAACQKLIESMNIPTPTYLKAMKYLMDNKEWRGVFGRMSEEHRWGWVASLE